MHRWTSTNVCIIIKHEIHSVQWFAWRLYVLVVDARERKRMNEIKLAVWVGTTSILLRMHYFCIAITIGISDFTRGCTQRLISLSLNRSRLIVSEWTSRPHCPVMKRIFPERSSQWFPMFFIFTAARYSPPIMKGKTISIMPLSGSAYTI